MSTEKPHISLRGVYKKPEILNKEEIIKMISEKPDNITMEIKGKNKYTDNTQELIISIKYQ